VTKSELVIKLSQQDSGLTVNEVNECVASIIDQMKQAMKQHERIEIRNFGSFDVHHVQERVGRNPKTGQLIKIDKKLNPRFKPGKYLKQRLNGS